MFNDEPTGIFFGCVDRASMAGILSCRSTHRDAPESAPCPTSPKAPTTSKYDALRPVVRRRPPPHCLPLQGAHSVDLRTGESMANIGSNYNNAYFEIPPGYIMLCGLWAGIPSVYAQGCSGGCSTSSIAGSGFKYAPSIRTPRSRRRQPTNYQRLSTLDPDVHCQPRRRGGGSRELHATDDRPGARGSELAGNGWWVGAGCHTGGPSIRTYTVDPAAVRLEASDQ
ncbi:hypothetical protein GGX14DRAFT_571707 [Mycena pura]|uniref:Uncharacterized protein n=1 Tax=Mycena pura TaxID=153505 RepID=A0AAD6V2K8_9AGAR|nr:hypothetical protein GGX14DRAFT_571707 [Mycena pura]